MSNYADKVAEVKTLNVYELASAANCLMTDTRTSAGARWLSSVRDDVLVEVHGVAAEDFARLTEDIAHSIADSSVPVYTGQKWATFVDLGAYQEDVSDLIDTQDFDKMSDVALYAIAERLVSALLGELAAAIDEGDLS